MHTYAVTSLRPIAPSVAFVVLALCGIACSSAGTKASPAGADGGVCMPPTGFQTVVPLGALGTLYAHESLVLSAKDEPRVAFVAYDGADFSKSALYFSAYDLTTCGWKAPVKIDTVENLDNNAGRREVTLVRDASNDHLAIAYEVNAHLPLPNGDTHEMLAHSTDGGATWTKEEIAHNKMDPGNNNVFHLGFPTVAMANGKTAYAYYSYFSIAGSCSTYSECDAYSVLTRTGETGPFAGGIVQSASGSPGAEGASGALAMDSAGNAGFIFYSRPDPMITTLVLNYLKPGASKATAIFDSQTIQNDQPALALAFDGTKPRVVAALQRSAASTGSNVWSSVSDDGTTWNAPVEIPSDAGDTMGGFLSLASDGKGNFTLASDQTGGSGMHGACGAPKLSTSTNLMTWQTCGADRDPASGIGAAGRYVQLAYTTSGKRIAAFDYTGDAPALKAGVVVWREP
jgi:hypothetical protein